MPALFLPRRWRRQPVGPVVIDRGHPIGAKVHYAYTPWLGLGAVTPGQRARSFGVQSGMVLAATPAGIAGQVTRTGAYAGGGLYASGDPSNMGSPNRATVFVLIDRLSHNGTTDTAGLLRISSGDRLQIMSEAAGRKLQLYLYSGARGNGEAAIGDGFTGSVALTARGLQTYRIHVNGRLDAQGTTGGFNIRDFRGLGAGSIRWPTWACPMFLYADELQDAEISALHQAPWQIFRPQPSRRIIVGPSGPPIVYQYARPAADVQAGGWAPSDGSSLAAMLAEETPDDATFIETREAGTAEVKLSAVSLPANKSRHALSYRLHSVLGMRQVVRLKQGAAVIAEWTHDPAPTVPTTFRQTLTPEQAALITDGADLRVSVEALS